MATHAETSRLEGREPKTALPHKMRSLNPANDEELCSYPELDSAQLDQKVARSEAAYKRYRRSSFAERASIVVRAAEILENEKERWARLMSLEMGKTHQSAIDEALKCARTCRFYAEKAAVFLADQPIESRMGKCFVVYQPLGPILAIMPWNFPFWQVFRFAAPALMAGNTVLLKHASNVPQCALMIEEIWRRAGAAEGLFQTLLVGSSDINQALDDPRIAAVTLTGSDKAGAQVASRAGRNLKKVVLELGGSDPFIVMPSADLDHTVSMAVAARTVNNGESCVAAKRFIVHESIADEFERKFSLAMGQLKVGDPLDPQTQIGPLATAAIRDGLVKQVDESVRAGAKVLTGGRVLAGPGNFFEPTVLAAIPRTAPAWKEEFFGPVALVFRARDMDEAIEIANDSPFGLGSSLWSADPREHELFVREIAAGMAFVNAQVTSDPPLPFGGIKRSGYGRELGEFGIREFVNIKSICIRAQTGSAGAQGTE